MPQIKKNRKKPCTLIGDIEGVEEKKTNGLASSFLSLQFIPLPHTGIGTRDHEE